MTVLKSTEVCIITGTTSRPRAQGSEQPAARAAADLSQRAAWKWVRPERARARRGCGQRPPLRCQHRGRAPRRAAPRPGSAPAVATRRAPNRRPIHPLPLSLATAASSEASSWCAACAHTVRMPRASQTTQPSLTARARGVKVAASKCKFE